MINGKKFPPCPYCGTAMQCDSEEYITAVCLVLHRDYGFGQGRCHKVLSALDAEMSPGGQLTIQGAIDQVYDEIGLALNFDEPFDRIEKMEAKKT